MGRIFRQSSILFLSQGFARGIGFLYTIFLARNLGVEDFGLFSAALAFYALISTVAELGFNRFIVREIALERMSGDLLITSVSLLRLTFTSVLFAIFAIVFYIFDPDKIRVCLMLFAIVAVLPVSFSQTIDGIFVGLRKLQFSGLSLIITSLVTALLGVYFVTSGFGTTGALVALIIGQAVYAITLIIFLKLGGIKMITRTNLSTVRQIIIGSLPYGILGILGLLYFRIDTLMLSYLRGNFDTGIYGAGYKFLEALVLIPTSLSAAIFPVMAKLHQDDKQQLKGIYYKSIKLMGLIGVAVILVYNFILPPIVRLLLPSYSGSIEVIKILSLSAPFMFIHVPASQVLLSAEKYLKPLVWLSFLPLTFNVVLNFIFIPQYGYLAAAWITVLSDIFSFGMLLIFINRKLFR